MRAHDVKTLEDTCELVGDDITELESVLRVLGLTQLKVMSKATPASANTPLKGSPAGGHVRKSRFSCGNFGGDHDNRASQHKDECPPCKTKVHAF